MKEHIQLAWRNLWRNKRRTILTISSVFFAVFLALLMRSMQVGTYGSMINTVIKNTTGYIQIHAPGYWDDKTINNTFENSEELDETLLSTDNITSIIPRLESFALASSGDQTKGVAVIGTHPGIENKTTALEKKLIRGRYFNEGKDEILLAENLAKYLKVDTGDSIVLLSQGYHGVTAAGEFRVIGILHFTAPDMNNQLVYMRLEDAQYFYAAPNRLTSLSIMLDEPDNLAKTANTLISLLGNDYEIMTWKQMLKELMQGIQSDNISGLFMLGILYMVVAFGIFGTMLMMTMERKREFALLVSVGMQRFKLSRILFLETIFIAIIAIITGVIASIPLIWHFFKHPIRLTGEAAKAMTEFNAEPVMPFAFEWNIFLNQSIVVLILTFLAVIYPIVYVLRFNILKAFKGK